MQRSASVLLFSAFIFPAGLSHGQDRNAAIAEIEKMLPLVCGEFSNSGHSTSLSVKGDAEAKLNGLIKKLVDLGVSGAGEFNSDQYVGVLRTEVGAQLTDVRKCRQQVLGDMLKLVNSGTNAGIVNNGDNNVNIQGSGNTVAK